MNCKISRLLGLFMVMFTMSMPTLASNHYYSKAVATAVGAGKVYASNFQTNSPDYTTGSSEATNNSTGQNPPTHTYYLYAQANEGNVFDGWYEKADCSGTAASKEASYKVSFDAESTEEKSPTTKTFYAKFVSAGAPILGYTETRIYANISAGTYKNETLTASNITDAITYESSNENVATVAADGTVTLKKSGSCFIKAKANGVEASYTLTVIDDVAAGVTQIGNGDFEDWRSATSSNHAPDNWNSFETAEGQYAGLFSAKQVQMVEGGRPGSDGLYCVDIWSRSVMGVVTQGNLTTGCINAGATSASAKANYNYSKTSDTAKSETLSQIPTAIRFWAKFVPAAANAQHPNARMEAVVHDNYNYITYSDPSYESDEEKSHAIAKAKKDFPTTNGEWVEFVVPFELTGNATDGQLYIIVNLYTNADAGQGKENDHLYIDDIELVYETESDEVTLTDGGDITALDTYKGQEVKVNYTRQFTEGKTSTVCLPFAYTKKEGDGSFYAFTNIKKENGEYVATMTEPGTTTLEANTPYLYLPNATGDVDFGGAYTIPAELTAGETTSNGWTFKGTFTTIEWTTAPVGTYGFSAQNQDGISQGQFVKVGNYVKIKPMRCYLENANFAGARGTNRAAEQLPETIKVRLISANGEVTGIGTISTKTGEGTMDKDAWYSLDGRRVKNPTKGMYIKNGQKVVIK